MNIQDQRNTNAVNKNDKKGWQYTSNYTDVKLSFER